MFDSFLNEADRQYILSVHQKTTGSKTLFEINITTNKTTLYSAQFYCQAYWSLQLSNHSNVVTVSTVDLPPSPNLRSNVSQVLINEPFTLTCSLVASFKPHNFDYHVTFYDNRDGLLAEYKVNGK